MTAMASWGVYSVGGTPVTVTTGASSATVALPTDSTGTTARYVRLLCATGNAYVRLGTSGAVTVTGGAGGNGILVGASNDIVLYCRGSSHIAHIQSGSATALNIVPVEV